jgi:uncharacterized membrane protein
MNEHRRRSGFSGHPLHPLFTHFPMALWMVSLLWDLLGIWRGDPLWWSFSFWSIAVGLIFALFAVVTGLIDFAKIPQSGSAEVIAIRHMLLVMTATILYAGSFFARLGVPIPSGIKLIIALALSVLGFILLLVGGWFGGELVYRYGIGRSGGSEPILQDQGTELLEKKE